jgi:Lon protease-like protein
MAFRLPIFPLSVVLFPGTPLPLHIFEPRYRKMLADCLAADRRFGIVPESGPQEVPAQGTVGCIAEVRVNQELPDGRSNIIVLGGARFELRQPVEGPEPYHVAMVEPYEERDGTEPSSESLGQLRDLFRRYSALLRQLNDVEPAEPVLPEDGVGLSFHVSAGIECDLGVKQRLLAERSTARRVEALILLIPILTSGVESGLRVHRRAHTNGRGHSQPDFLAST